MNYTDKRQGRKPRPQQHRQMTTINSAVSPATDTLVHQNFYGVHWEAGVVIISAAEKKKKQKPHNNNNSN